MAVLTEGTHAGEIIVSELPRGLSRDAITVISGQNLVAGAVLGKIVISTTAATAVAGANTGNGAMGAITVGAGAQVGVYSLIVNRAVTNAGDFEVIDPQGDVVGIGHVASAFSGGGLAFTLADGATDFAVNDSFAITVGSGSGKYTEHNAANTNGSQVAAGILFAAVDASLNDKPGVAWVRVCEGNVGEITWKSGISAANKAAGIAALAAQNVIVR